MKLSKNVFLCIVLCITMVLLCSCESDITDYNYIDIANIKRLIVEDNPAYQKEYSDIPSELKSVLKTVDNMTAEQESPIQFTDVDFSVSDSLLWMTLEQNDGSLVLLTVYVISDDEGIVRWINQPSENVQTVFACFRFRNIQLIDEIHSIQAMLDE